MKRTGIVLLWIVGVFLIARAVVEPFVIDFTEPSTYRQDWGGPHLAGVLAVHLGPGVIALALMIRSLTRRAKPPRSRAHRGWTGAAGR